MNKDDVARFIAWFAAGRVDGNFEEQKASNGVVTALSEFFFIWLEGVIFEILERRSAAVIIHIAAGTGRIIGSEHGQDEGASIRCKAGSPVKRVLRSSLGQLNCFYAIIVEEVDMGNLIARRERVKHVVLRPQRGNEFPFLSPFLNRFHGLGREFNNLALSRVLRRVWCRTHPPGRRAQSRPDLLNDGPLVIAPFDLRNGTLSA